MDSQRSCSPFVMFHYIIPTVWYLRFRKQLKKQTVNLNKCTLHKEEKEKKKTLIEAVRLLNENPCAHSELHPYEF